MPRFWRLQVEMGRASIRAGDREDENVESWYQKTGGGHPGESEWGLGAESSLDLRTVERLHPVGWDWCVRFGCFLRWENRELGQTGGSYVGGVWMDRLRIKPQVPPLGAALLLWQPCSSSSSHAASLPSPQPVSNAPGQSPGVLVPTASSQVSTWLHSNFRSGVSRPEPRAGPHSALLSLSSDVFFGSLSASLTRMSAP